jgi:imidazolonepropionase
VSLLVDHVGVLVTNDPTRGAGPLGLVEDAYLVADDDGRVAAVGPRPRAGPPPCDERLDAGGACVLPGFVDSHTHLVFAGDRSAEFVTRMAGRPYEAGGINATVAATRAASTDQLRTALEDRRRAAYASGTTTIEIKSGYGLTAAHESRLLSLAGEHTAETTALAAHVAPPELRSADAYVEQVCDVILPAVAGQARWVDAFCERGAFDADQCRAVLEAGRRLGLDTRLHANQLGPGPGARLAAELGCASADHCTFLDAGDVEALAGAGTVATLLPLTEFSTRQPYPDARRLLAAGVTVALATNCNPGSSYSTAMSLCIALAVREMGLTIEEAVLAATAGGAAALRRSDVGRLSPGAPADFLVLDAPSYAHLAYRPGEPLVALAAVGGAVRFRRDHRHT